MISLQPSDPQEGTLRDLGPDLTPMLDILFILLVFFMLTAGAALQSLDLKLPSSVSDTKPIDTHSKHIMLEIHPHHYVIDTQKIDSLPLLKKALPPLVQAKKEHEMVIAGDKDISIERLLEVLTYLQSEGIETANILMKKQGMQP